MKQSNKLIFSKFAARDLDEIIGYYKSINIDYCRDLFNSIELKTTKLKEFPEYGRIVPELEKQNINDYRELLEGNYRIIYSIQNSTVIIHTIIDSRRNLEELLIRKLLRE